ncbi:hypothetical protein QBC46DRAFT_368499 [Diplogelasinospora grovesii]|uniref:Uncharacterized protein n=1 Tax=Diplogelasinospora grovesii TaxID=303347 RepID=A0AAN6MV22_9PEZI|nr:hypothetical protein QBC46DRAFT_368499 [Diplogelasinospora grovesii]
MDGKILFNIGNWIPIVLVLEFGLDSSIKNKSGLYDVFVHKILRAEIALALIVISATVTRLNALIEKLCYKDVKFHMFPPTLSSKRARIGIVVTLRKIKQTTGKLKLKKYSFHEEDTLLRDPILYILSLTFTNGAFKNDFKSPEDIYDLNVLKEEWRDKLIFRDIKSLGKKVTIALNQALPCGKVRKFLIKLGRALSYEKLLKWYDLRRGFKKKLNKALTLKEQIVFGSEPRLIRRNDVLINLTEEQRAEISNNKKLLKLKRRKKGRGAELRERYNRFTRQADTLRKTLHDNRLTRAIYKFHALRDSEEIAR